MRKGLLTVCATLMFATFAFQSVSAQSLEGTEWDDNTTYFQFKAESKVLLSDDMERDNEEYQRWGTWKQDGDKVFIDVLSKKTGNSAFTIQAVIKGDKMEGTLRFRNSSYDHEWSARKVK